MVLQNKNAVIYGAGGSLGGALARAFAEAGARVFLTGRNLPSVKRTADEIIAKGGSAEAEVLDALQEAAINTHLDRLIQRYGTVDISFNAVGEDVVQGKPLSEIDVEDFMSPIALNLRTRFLTAKAVAKHMIRQKSGVILNLTATPGGIGYPYTAGFAPACAGVEALTRNLASELGIYGIRAVNIRSGGSPDSRHFKEAFEKDPEAMALVFKSMANDTMLKSLPLMADIANTAVFLVSDLAGKITGVTVDATAGTTAALNYRAQA